MGRLTMSLDADTAKKVVWGKACVSFVWRECVPTRMSCSPRSVPAPVKKCPIKEWRRRRAEKRSSKMRKWTATSSQLVRLRFSDVLIKEAEKKRTLRKHPFRRPFPRRTPSPLLWRILSLGGFPATPDPNTSAKVSRWKWEPYRNTNEWC